MESKVRSIKPVAIVGMASHFPGATSLFDFWNNIQNKTDSVSDNLGLDGYWKKEDFYEPNSKDKDKTYAHKAGWIPPIDFDPVEFKLPPNMVESISTAQLFALHVAKKALLDARIIGDNPIAVNKQKVGVILGGGGNGNTSFMLAARQQAPFVKNILSNSGLPDYVVDDVIDRLLHQYLEWNEDSFPGFLGNVACGRISSCFDLGGTSNMVDAACASSLAAMKAAVSELDSGSCDAVVTGGVNLENSIFSFLCFSRTPALSPTNISRPFDKKSDGMMLGDGVGIMVLKRLEDAVESGDKIYAVIKGLSGSSDGKAKSIFAPRKEGQVLAINRAYKEAGITAADIQLVEAHGTGTAAGDQTEIKSLEEVFRQDPNVDNQSVAVGSIKSQIGHTRCAAGAASVMKIALALHHKVLPATINIEQPNKQLANKAQPFYVNTENRPWIQKDHAAIRHGAVSAFGFGGTNYHMVLEEFSKEQTQPYRFSRNPVVMAFSAKDKKQLVQQCEQLLNKLKTDQASEHLFNEIGLQKDKILEHSHARITFSSCGVDDTVTQLNAALKQMKSTDAEQWDHPLGIYFRDKGKVEKSRSDVVLLFPGQGSQYVNMGRELCNEFPEIRKAFSLANSVRNALDLPTLSDLTYPIPSFSEKDITSAENTLKNTANAQPAIGSISLGMLNVLKGFGLKADYYAGHSFGELTALCAAGAYSESDFLKLASLRGDLMSKGDAGQAEDRGAMLAVSISETDAKRMISNLEGLTIANVNAQDQVVIGGASEAVKKLQDTLQSDGIKCSKLPVSAAFHTPFVAHASEEFSKVFNDIKIEPLQGKVYANVSAEPYASDGLSVKKLLTKQLSSTVKFKHMIEKIYQDGGRYFVEIGPKGVLTGLVSNILKDKPHSATSFNPSNKGSDSAYFRKAIAKLVADGVLTQWVDPYQLIEAPIKPVSSISVPINGGYYSSAATKKRQEHGKRKDSTLVDKFVKEQADAYIETEVNRRWLVLESDHFKNVDNAVPDVIKTEQQQQTSDVSHLTSSNGQADIESATHSYDSELAASPLSMLSVGAEENIHYPTQEQVMTQITPNPTDQDVSKQVMLSTQIQSQSLSSQVHQQFQTNQAEYIKFLNSMLTQQFQLFDKHANSTSFNGMVHSLNKSLELMEMNQQCYHNNHGLYFNNQQSLLGKGQNTKALNVQTLGNGATTSNGNAPMSNGHMSNGHTNGQLNGTNVPSSSSTLNTPATNGATAVENGSNALSMNGSTPIQAKATTLPDVPTANVSNGSASNGQMTNVEALPVSNTPVVKQSQADLDALSQLKQITPESLSKELIKIIGEKTGYPEDMIGVDMDLEADLGIDSIKRIEIIGAMFESFETGLEMQSDSEDYSEMDSFDVEEFSTIERMVNFLTSYMQEFIDHLEQGGTLQNLEQKLKGEATDDNSVVAESTEHHVVALSDGGRDVAETNDEVDQEVAQVMKSIGFVASSAELVDKQVVLPKSEPAEKVITKLNTESVGQPYVQPVVIKAESMPTFVVDNTKDAVPINRFKVYSKTLPMPDEQTIKLPKESIWLVIDEGHNAANLLLQSLVKTGAPVAYMSSNNVACKLPEGVIGFNFESSDESAIVDKLAAIQSQLGTVGGVVLMQQPPGKYALTLDQLNEQDKTRLTTAFVIAKTLSTKIQNLQEEGAQTHFFVAAQMDGNLGVEGKQGYGLFASGITGLVKSLNFEWPQVKCRLVDIKPKLAAKKAAHILMQELADIDSSLIEVARGDGSKRFTLALDQRPCDLNVSQLTDQDVFLVTGGARGITAECVIELAMQSKASFIILGRTDIDAKLPEWATDLTTPDELRKSAIKDLSSKGEQPTPVKINRMVSDITRIAEVSDTLKRIELAGGNATYLNVDITDHDKVTDAIRATQESFGKITGVIHGAGNLADKKIEKKTLADFELVVDTKVQGLINVLEAIDPNGLKNLLMFSSVSGFFGNAGQTDYAIANEILNKFVHTYTRYQPNLHVKSICWGPWDSGMVNDTLKKAYKDRNIAIIPTEVGVKRFVEEFASGAPQVIIGSEKYHTAKLPKKESDTVHYSRPVNVVEEPVLLDHIIEGDVVLPATFAMQWLMQSASYLVPNATVTGISNFTVLKGLTFKERNEENLCFVEANVESVDSKAKHCVISVKIASKQGDAKRYHYAGNVQVSVSNLPIDLIEASLVNLSDNFNLNDLNGRSVYSTPDNKGWLFSGPTLQGIDSVQVLTDDQIIATIEMQAPTNWLSSPFSTGPFNPCIADVLLQVPYLWSVLQTDKLGLPSAIDEVEIFTPLNFGSHYDVCANITSNTASKLVSDIQVVDREKKVIVASLKGVQFTQSKALREKLLG
ncbi:MAG: acyl transferase domain-containing protein [Alteromonadaceae bacterium]|jgi:acyl transferase domain-containing protein/NAD(P)-dependent dehydrogenase (short-subunit alcohol dehydrogenase family)